MPRNRLTKVSRRSLDSHLCPSGVEVRAGFGVQIGCGRPESGGRFVLWRGPVAEAFPVLSYRCVAAQGHDLGCVSAERGRRGTSPAPGADPCRWLGQM